MAGRFYFAVQDDEINMIQDAFEELLKGPDHDDESDPGITQP